MIIEVQMPLSTLVTHFIAGDATENVRAHADLEKLYVRLQELRDMPGMMISHGELRLLVSRLRPRSPRCHWVSPEPVGWHSLD